MLSLDIWLALLAFTATTTTTAQPGAQQACAHVDDMVDERSRHLALFRDVLLNRVYNPHPHLKAGGRLPPGANALTMAGQRRLDNFAALVATAVEDGVEGDIIETGVWRGGTSFMAAMTLQLAGAKAAHRIVYLADSFRGIPEQTTYKTAGSAKHVPVVHADKHAHEWPFLNNNSPERVRKDALAVGLRMSQLRLVVGYFNESLPRLLRSEVRFLFFLSLPPEVIFL